MSKIGYTYLGKLAFLLCLNDLNRRVVTRNQCNAGWGCVGKVLGYPQLQKKNSRIPLNIHGIPTSTNNKFLLSYEYREDFLPLNCATSVLSYLFVVVRRRQELKKLRRNNRDTQFLHFCGVTSLLPLFGNACGRGEAGVGQMIIVNVNSNRPNQNYRHRRKLDILYQWCSVHCRDLFLGYV